MESTISKQKLQEFLNGNNKVTIIDVRSSEEFEAQHIPNAINIPVDELQERIINMGQDQLFVTACGKGGGRSEKGASILNEMGYKAFFLEGGTFGWFE